MKANIFVYAIKTGYSGKLFNKLPKKFVHLIKYVPQRLSIQ